MGVVVALAGAVAVSDLPSVLLTASILEAGTVAVFQTVSLTVSGFAPRRTLGYTLAAWVGVVAVASPIGGLRRPGAVFVWIVQTAGQGGSLAVIATIGLVGVVRTARATGEHSIGTTDVERPTDTQLLGVIGVSVGALVGLAVGGPVIPAVFAAGAWGTALASDGPTRLSAVAAGLVVTGLVIEAVVTGGVYSFVIAAVVTLVAVTLLPSSPVRHAGFAVAMGFQIGLYLDLQTAQLGAITLTSFLLPGALFAGITLLVSTVSAGLFNGRELLDQFRTLGRDGRSVFG
ncbi:MAG: hypothetical protein ABEI99_09740 [Halobaculum sp.]